MLGTMQPRRYKREDTSKDKNQILDYVLYKINLTQIWKTCVKYVSRKECYLQDVSWQEPWHFPTDTSISTPDTTANKCTMSCAPTIKEIPSPVRIRYRLKKITPNTFIICIQPPLLKLTSPYFYVKTIVLLCQFIFLSH